jgi:S-adenosylmethionine decarboxylase
MHLAVDGYGGDLEKMWDEEVVRSFLRDYPSVLGMTKLCDPQVLTYHAPKIEDSGISGFVIIAESHISIHTFPNRQYINVDVFSCKSFDNQRALQDVKEYFALRNVRTWVLDRGLEHLENPPPD